MTTKRTQIHVGMFAIGSLALLGLVLVTFGGLHFFKHKNHYAIDFPDSVLGLENGAGVYFNGIEVGSVDAIEVAPDDVSKVRVSISVDTKAPVHTDTQAFISMAGLTGLKTIDLKGGSATTALLESGGQLAPGMGTLDKLQKRAEELVDTSGVLLARASKIVDGAQRVMDNLVAATDPKPIAEITAATAKAARTLAATASDIQSLVAENRSSLHQSLGSIASATQSAADLMADVRGVVDGNATELQATMVDIRQASRSFKELAREVRDRPSRLLFSSNPHDRKLP